MSAQCTRRTTWVSAFLAALVVAFTAHLLGVLTPSWQYVYLEDGRTEHHHGLWLDCKRDYSNEYGRPREYYESIYRLNHLQNPFDQFWFPHLQCVYKFDYWLDDEDWYEHGYDENRLQGDAYQHLFIGWKIAAFTAHAFALVCTLNGVIMLFCGYCHRLSICVAAVLVTLSAISCAIGNAIFYMFASYQDNNIIREEDGIYEQYFGWSFYSALAGSALLILCAILGCSATSAVLSTERTRHVKIEMNEDGAQLLRMSKQNAGVTTRTKNRNSKYLDSIVTSTMTTAAPPGGGSNSSYDSDEASARFRRSKSAVYKIDSNELRNWEREAIRGVALNTSATDFKRANSLPNVAKRVGRELDLSRNSLHKGFSNADLTNIMPADASAFAPIATNTTREFIPSREPIKIHGIADDASSRRPNSRKTDELIYECVDENLMAYDDNASSSVFHSEIGNTWLKSNMTSKKKEISSKADLLSPSAVTTLNTYDRVPLAGCTFAMGANTALDMDKDEYLKPMSSEAASTNGSDANGSTTLNGETTFMSNPTELERQRQEKRKQQEKQKVFCNELQQKQQQRMKQQASIGINNRRIYEHEIYERKEREKHLTNSDAHNNHIPKSVSNAKDCLKSYQDQKLPNASYSRQYPTPSAPYLTIKNDEVKVEKKALPSCFQINTFQAANESPSTFSTNGTLTAGNLTANNRSLVNLVSIANDRASTVSVFDRRDSIDFSAELDAALRSPQPLSLSSSTPTRRTPSQLDTELQPRYFGDYRPSGYVGSNIKETNFNGSDVGTPKKQTSTTGYYHPLESGINGRNTSLLYAESEMDRSMGSITTYNLDNRNNSIPNGNSPASNISSIASPPWKQNIHYAPAKINGEMGTSRTMI